MQRATRSMWVAWLAPFAVGACSLVTDTDALSKGAGASAIGCTPDLLFCDDFDRAGFSEIWTSKELGNAMFTPDGVVDRSPIDTAPSQPNTLLVSSSAGAQGAVEGPRLKKTFPPGTYATIRVRFDMLIERWEPGGAGECCALWPFLLVQTLDDGGYYFFGVGNNLFAMQLFNSPQPGNNKTDQAPLFDRLKVGVWNHIESLIEGSGGDRKATLRVDGAKQATVPVPADFPRPNLPLTFYAGAAWLYSPAALRVRLDNVVVDTK